MDGHIRFFKDIFLNAKALDNDFEKYILVCVVICNMHNRIIFWFLQQMPALEYNGYNLHKPNNQM